MTRRLHGFASVTIGSVQSRARFDAKSVDAENRGG